MSFVLEASGCLSLSPFYVFEIDIGENLFLLSTH